MAFLDEVKTALRITVVDPEIDNEIQGLIDAAIADLILAGVAPLKAQDTTDPLIKRAIIVYCRAHFDYADPAADRLLRSYDLLKQSLSLAGDYSW
ncbi:head-tail connector protein [Acinetobacter sp.]|uniref:head-tail connector protein n=1 Tax=Acinetobacter sp. TaxID=472 RepID=UPI003D0355D5